MPDLDLHRRLHDLEREREATATQLAVTASQVAGLQGALADARSEIREDIAAVRSDLEKGLESVHSAMAERAKRASNRVYLALVPVLCALIAGGFALLPHIR